ncbi:hypothetical protein ACWGMU_27780, partial [Streptomyces diastaticus]
MDFWEGFDFGFGWDLGLALALGALLARALRAAARAAWARLAAARWARWSQSRYRWNDDPKFAELQTILDAAVRTSGDEQQELCARDHAGEDRRERAHAVV